jgi:SAM-dependent methyltransferase
LGQGTLLQLVEPSGAEVVVAAAEWVNELRAGDESLLDRCHGATLDVGCGPGRLTAALVHRGHGPHGVLGVDVSAEAVRQAQRRGAPALRRDVFSPLPREGQWQTVLLADGNVGIGGDPAALLSRCRRLLHRDGAVLMEVTAPGSLSWAGQVTLRLDDRCSDPFPWARIGADDVAEVAACGRLRVLDVWTEAQRWFAQLIR